MSKVLRPVRLLLLGAPGSGKGTQTGRLLKDFSQISAISSGDLLRQNIRSGSELGKTEKKKKKSYLTFES